MSRKWPAKSVYLTLACVLSIVGCDSGNEPEISQSSASRSIPVETPAANQADIDESEPKAEPLLVEMDVAVKEVTQKHLMAVGKTNLPDQTLLEIRLVRDASNVSWRAKTLVAAGVFEAGPLGPSSGLVAGDYTLHITTPPADVQPTEVKAIIGKKGELIDGPFVERSPHGLGRIVKYITTYEVAH